MNTLRVSQLNGMIREFLDAAFPEEIWVVGEIQGYRLHAKSGHIYFDLVEKSEGASQHYLAKVSCAFFRGSVLKWRGILRQQGLADFSLEDGMEIRLRARVDFFAKEGRYQLIVGMIDPAYILGALARKRAQTVETLRQEGLLGLNRELEFPRVPLEVGLITSDGSAAYNDFVSVLTASGLGFSVKVFDAHMQGRDTVRDVVRGLRRLDGAVDVIVLTRGGGGRTDLVYFDDLAICRAIASGSTPVITGIGHEIDLSVADMVASRHLVTPTDTARFLVGAVKETDDFIAEAARQLRRFGREQVEDHRIVLKNRAAALAHMAEKMVMSGLALLGKHARELGFAAGNTVREQRLGLQGDLLKLKHASGNRLRDADHHLRHLADVLKLLDPGEMFRRGYALLTDEAGRALHSVAGLAPGQKITAVLSDGRIRGMIEEVQKNEK